MKKNLLLTLLIFIFCSSFSHAQILEEKTVDKNVKFQSAEDIINDLKAKKEAEKPFDDKDVKVDLESLGLDDVDTKLKKKTDEVVSIVKEKDLFDNTPKPSTAVIPQASENDIQKQILEVTNKINNSAPINPAEVSNNNPGVLSKIKNLFKNDNPQDHITIPTTTNKTKPTAPLTKAQKKAAFKERIAQEKTAANQRKKQKLEEEKMIKLNKLRSDFLIKTNKESAEDDYDEYRVKPTELLPREKNYNYKERFISYETPPAPLLDNYRGNENEHIPLILSPQDKVDILFKIIDQNSDGNPAAFQSAYEYVLNPNIRNQYGETLLTYSTLLQKYAIISSVLAKGADPDLPNALGHTPLDIAIEMLDLKAANILISMNADINYIDGYGRTYLMHAARVGFFPMVDLFVTKGANINAIDYEGYSALAIAYRHKKDLIVKYLLKNGAESSTPKNYKPQNQNMIEELKTRWQGSGKKY